MEQAALNTKLAEWAGWVRLKDTTLGWKTPDGDMHFEATFTEDLSLCFKWLVPKTIKSADYSITITQNLARCVGYVRPMQGGKQYDAIDNRNPALALCLAIERLIDDS